MISVLLLDFSPAAKVDCQPAHTDDGDAPEEFPKDGRSWDVRPAMEGGPVTEGCEMAHSENVRDNHQEGRYILPAHIEQALGKVSLHPRLCCHYSW